MATRSAAATRASSKTKVASTSVVPKATKVTRTRTNTEKPAAATPPKKTTSRKPFVNKDNGIDPPPSKPPSKTTTTRKTVKTANAMVSDSDREPIMAYLRIRPHLGEDAPALQPYLVHLSDTTVRMSDLNDQQTKASNFRSSTVSPTSTYTFSQVFPPETSQSDFFTRTTLPLVNDLLQGQNSLLFTYGVTNSGKTYTIQGGSAEGSAGILPRSLDVIFNSIDGLHGDGRFRPVRLQGIEPAEPQDSKPPQMAPEPAFAEVFEQQLDTMGSDSDVDPTVLKVDRNYEYTVWISYAEVYNEKIFDLLASVKDDANQDGNASRTTGGKPLVLTRMALPLKPSPKSDHVDSPIQGKYIAGLRQFRVHSAAQAKALLKLGQLHRRVFGTLANRESSRSHGMVIIKVVKSHRGDRDDPEALQISRLTLVDLAGSERTKHTHTTGDRLKEAGNINKSLMVLGQCMEVMRTNQRKVAVSLSQGVEHDDQLDTRNVKKGLAIVPFRHSKLTEALIDYFIGDGRAVMIVNVNPYDTGYDENSHVMRFAALAREVYVTPVPAPVHRLPNGLKAPGRAIGDCIKELGPLTLKNPEVAPLPHRRKVTISMGGRESGGKIREAVLEVLEEDEPDDGNGGDDEDEPINPLVDALFDEIDMLRTKLFEAEMRCALVEAETREEVMQEMEERMKNMEEMYNRRLMKELEHNEMKTDAKIDMLHQSGFLCSPMKKVQPYIAPRIISEDEAEEEDVENSLIIDDEAQEMQEDSPLSDISSPSPFLKKHKSNVKVKPSRTVAKALFSESEEDKEEDDKDDEDSEDDWVPPPKAPFRVIPKNPGPSKAKNKPKAELSTLEDEMDNLSIEKDKKTSANAAEDGDDDELVLFAKKKKRQLGTQPIMSQEAIERATYAMEKQAAKFNGMKSIRRLTNNK